MDYGREAYSLATELERRLGSASMSFSAVRTEFNGECPSGATTKIAQYNGGAALIVLSVTSSGEGSIDVMLGGAKTGELQAGGTFTFAFAAAETGVIALTPTDGVTVSSVTVSAVGSKCAFAETENAFAACERQGTAYALENSDGLRLKKWEVEGFTDLARFAESEDFDIAASPDGILVAACDGRGNCTLTMYSLGKLRYSATVPDCRRVSLSYNGGGFDVGAYDGRRVRVVRYSSDLLPLESARVHGSTSVDKLALVKGSTFPSILINDGGKVLSRQPSSQTRYAVRAACAASLVQTGGS